MKSSTVYNLFKTSEKCENRTSILKEVDMNETYTYSRNYRTTYGNIVWRCAIHRVDQKPHRKAAYHGRSWCT